MPENYTKQERFTDDVGQFWLGFIDQNFNENEEPPYQANTRKRDAWLRTFSLREPHLTGVINSVIAIDKNRAWQLIGGRNQVIRFSDIFHTWHAAPGLSGWRPGISSAALSYYTSDLGALIELGREGSSNGALRALYHLDSSRCTMTGSDETPLRYYPPSGKMQDWKLADFMRVASMPSTDEMMKGVGFCAVSRVIELVRIMTAIYRYDQEQLGDRAPRGLMLLQGITEAQWRTAIKGRNAETDSLAYQYFSPVMVLASGASTVEAKLIALSQLPANFDIKVFTDLLMFAYALSFGYDPNEFWPVQAGALGRGRESEIQAQKATGKGGLDFALGFQEQLQRDDILPDTIQFEFDQRDQESELVQAQVQMKWVEVITKILQTGIITDAQALSMLADHDIIPHQWVENLEVEKATDLQDADDMIEYTEEETETEEEEPEEETETEEEEPEEPEEQRQFPKVENRLLKERLRGTPNIIRAAQRFKMQPIVRYRFPERKIDVLWESGDDFLRRTIYPSIALGKEKKNV